jgi:hypothetical protein
LFQLTQLIHYIQDELYGDDGYPADEMWKSPEDVFPEAEEEYRLSLLLKERKAPLSALFGDEMGEAVADGSTQIVLGEEEDDEEDEDFNSDSEGHGSGTGSDDDGSDSTPLESKLLKAELAALSSADELSDEGDDGENTSKKTSHNGRKRRRSAETKSNTTTDPGKFDVTNIVNAKRKRSHVDYKKLAGELFGKDSNGQMIEEDHESDYGADKNSSDGSGPGEASSDEESGDETKEKDASVAGKEKKAENKLDNASKNILISKSNNRTKSVVAADFTVAVKSTRAPRGSKREDNLTCTCKKSKCLKLYCVCFAREIDCNERCRCQNCKNGKTPLPKLKETADRTNPEDLLLALKNDAPPNYKKNLSSSAAEDVPSLLLSLKNESTMPPIKPDQPRESAPTSDGLKSAEGGEDKQDGSKCSCRKSNCLKLYCFCMNNGKHCTDACACRQCLNRPTVKSSLQTRPGTPENERPPFGNEDSRSSPDGEKKLMGRKFGQELKTEGCNCKKSRCLKLYCVCYSNGLRCSRTCLCKDCANKGPILGQGETSNALCRRLSSVIILNVCIATAFRPSDDKIAT